MAKLSDQDHWSANQDPNQNAANRAAVITISKKLRAWLGSR